jgi:hypothetical protein
VKVDKKTPSAPDAGTRDRQLLVRELLFQIGGSTEATSSFLHESVLPCKGVAGRRAQRLCGNEERRGLGVCRAAGAVEQTCLSTEGRPEPD